MLKRSQGNIPMIKSRLNTRPGEEADGIRLSQWTERWGDQARITSRVQVCPWMHGCAFPRGMDMRFHTWREGPLGWQQGLESHPQRWQRKAWFYSGNCWCETRAECRNLRKANVLEGFTRDWSGLKEWETREFPWWLRGKESTWLCKRHRFSRWFGKIPRATEPLSLWGAMTEALAPEPMLCNKRSHDNEAHLLKLERHACSPQLEKSPHSNET